MQTDDPLPLPWAVYKGADASLDENTFGDKNVALGYALRTL